MLNLKIVSPEGILFQGQVDCVTVPGVMGEFQILTDHAPIISSLNEGDVSFKVNGGETTTKTIKSGFVEVEKNEVCLCIEL